ncbi:AGC family protein kinase [Favolaschia claudopus]|uniref:non-specific serine/threonine protein kinase n=1 Tax=Favolaschia claudopus TaxID=2862362 RepID=A0AAW0ABC5_9AGAR
MFTLVLHIASCVSYLASQADSIRCRALLASRRAVEDILLVAAGAFKAATKSKPSLTPPPTRTLPIWLPPTKTIVTQRAPPSYIGVVLLCVFMLLAVSIAVIKARSLARNTNLSNELPGHACVLHINEEYENIANACHNALPGPYVFNDPPHVPRRRHAEFWGSRSWKHVDHIQILHPLDPGKLRFVKALGSGAFGDVVQVWSSQCRVHLAVKRVRKTQPASSNQIALFSKIVWDGLLLEVEAHIRMNEDLAVPSMYGVFHDDQYFYLIMDCGIKSFDDEEVQIHSRKVALACGQELFRSVHALHERGIVHCDLKPANLLLAPQGQMLIIDYGVTHLFDHELPTDIDFPKWHELYEKTLAQPGTGDFPLLWPEDNNNPHKMCVRGGTPDFMSPAALAGKACSFGADLFALGTIIHEWLEEGLEREGDGEELTEVEVEFIQKMWSTEPSVRFESWREIFDHPFWGGGTG